MAAGAGEHPGRSLIWSLLESGGLSVLSLAVLLLVARFIGPAELGVFAIAIGVVQMLGQAVEMLLHDAIVQRRDLHEDHLHTAFWTCLGAGLALSAACWLGAPFVARFFANASVGDVLAISGLSLAATGAGCVPIAVLRRDLRFKPLALRSLVSRLLAAATAVVLVMAGAGLWSLVAQHLVQVLVNAVLVWPACRWRPRARFAAKRLAELLSFGWIAVSTELVWVSSVRVFMLLVGHFAGIAAAGHVSIAFRVVDTVYGLLAGAAHNLALPLFSRRQTDLPALRRIYCNATEFAALCTQPIAAGLAVCASPLVAVALGEVWLPAVPLVQLLALTAMVQFILLFAHATVTALGRPGLVLTLAVFALAYVVAGFLLLRPDTAFEATAIWASRIAIAAPILGAIVLRLLSLPLASLARLLWLPLLATALMSAAVIAVEQQALAAQPALVRLAAMIAVGGAVYVAVIALLGPDALRRLLAFVGDGLRGRAPPAASPRE